MEALRYRSWLDEIAFTDITGDMGIEIFHQVLPLSSHSWGREGWRSALGQRSKSGRRRRPRFSRAAALLRAAGLLRAFARGSGALRGPWLMPWAPASGQPLPYFPRAEAAAPTHGRVAGAGSGQRGADTLDNLI